MKRLPWLAAMLGAMLSAWCDVVGHHRKIAELRATAAAIVARGRSS